MYTQCPNCETAFRVTADLLKQAEGTVRCGGCSNTFNAIAFLSEDKPERTASEESISAVAENSAALLESLDGLAGSDVRIEDTGVEWLVLDEDESEDTAAPDPIEETGSMKWFLEDDIEASEELEAGVMADVFDDTGVMELDAELVEDTNGAQLDEFLEESPTEVDQFLTDTPNDVEAKEIFDAEPDSSTDTQTATGNYEELRFDDDTPLPDDFDFDAPSPPSAEQVIEQALAIEEPAEVPDELELGEDDEWESLLDEVAEDEEATLTPLDIDVEIAPPPEETAEITDSSGAFDAWDPDESGRDEGTGTDSTEKVTDTNAGDEASESGEMSIIEELEALPLDDEFGSTIVQDDVEAAAEELQPEPEQETTEEVTEEQDSIAQQLENTENIEEIVMEGDAVQTDAAQTRLDAEAEAAAEAAIDALRIGVDTRNPGSKSVRGGRRKTDPPSWGRIAATVLLGLLLCVQLLHHSRESLATTPLFNKTVAPVYRVLGVPVTPAWDVAGWRFEASNGSTNESGDVLTINSRIGNNSEQSMPYPLISVALTDRFEETIGSKILEPADYLGISTVDTQLIAPGDTFNATIEIATPAADATGFKLYVCYRMSSGQLRCALDEFR